MAETTCKGNHSGHICVLVMVKQSSGLSLAVCFLRHPKYVATGYSIFGREFSDLSTSLSISAGLRWMTS
jgi:hypothetical protein